MSKTNPFDYINSISQNKENLMRGTYNDDLAEREYKPFLTNKSLSYHQDTILISNMMNMNAQLDNKLQYEFLLNIVRPKKRYSKWLKNEVENNVSIISEYYDVPISVAKQYAMVLSNEQIDYLKQKLEKGGI
jgi:hypothetical protein